MKWQEGAKFELPPVGSHIARCYAVIDLGTQPQQKFHSEEIEHKRMVRLSFELPEELMAGVYNPDSEGKPFSVHLRAKASLHPKSKLRKMLIGWRGRDFKDDEVEKFDPKKLVGLPCRLQLVASENGEYVNIESIAPLGKKDKCPKQVNKSVFFSLEPEEFDQEAYDALHEKTRETIAKSPEYKQLKDGPGEEPQADAPEGDGGGTEHADEPF